MPNPKLTELYDPNNFPGVSPETRTDILGAIGLDLNEAKEDVDNKKFTQAELTQALHYLLGKKAKTNTKVSDLIVYEGSGVKLDVLDPFYFRKSDPFYNYLLLENFGHSHHHSGSDLGLIVPSGNCKPEEAAIIGCVVLVCSVGCCCYMCTEAAYKTEESEFVQNSKTCVASLLGLVTFILMTYFFITRDVGRHTAIDENDFSEEGYRLCQVLAGIASGLFSAASLLTIFNYILPPCLPNLNPEPPKPSRRVLEALKDLGTIDTLLDKGWHRENDDVEQCNLFIRAVIKMYIEQMAKENKPAPGWLSCFGTSSYNSLSASEKKEEKEESDELELSNAAQPPGPYNSLDYA